MNKFFQKTLFVISALLLVAGTAKADTPQYKYHKYVSTDGGIYEKISADGKWALVNLGMTMGGTTDHCPSQIVNTATGKMSPVLVNNRNLNIRAISNEDASGKVTIVGSLLGRPMSYYFDPKNPTTPGTLTVYNLTTDWTSGTLESVTPDGKYAVGCQTGYSGKDLQGAELGSDYWFNTIYVEIGQSAPIATPGAPKYDRNGNDQHAIKFEAISADGRYILGEREWFMPTEGFPFIYDTKTDTYKPIGFVTEGNRQKAQDGIEYLDFPVMSPNGRYVSALAALAPEGDAIATDNYLCRYDLQTGELTIFKDSESANVSPGCINDNGTIFGLPETGGPLRNFKVFYQDKYWIQFSQICQQLYGFNFSQKTGFEFTGSPTSVTADGTAFVAFSDPQAESYYFNLGTTIEDACSGIDLLKSYTISPESGSTFSTFKSVEINFGRAVQVVGKGNTHFHLYKKGKNGNPDVLVRDGLSTTGESGGLHLKANSRTIVVATIRNTTLEDGEEYYFVLDPGAVAVASDANMTNKTPIKASYFGRKEGPVKMTKAVPTSGSKLHHLDATTSYIQLTFDCPVKLTDSYEAYLERVEDGIRVTTLSLASGNTDATKNQLLVYPTTTIYLYDGVQYRVVLSAGSLSDYAGTESSYNEKIELTYTGEYVREVGNETTMFADNFNDPNSSLGKWLQYEGDHKTPQAEVAAWGFDADNTPWNFSTHDSESDPDYYATSHSLYAPSGESDDWMMTPQLLMPEDGKVVLEFDAQKYKAKDDHLWIYVIPEERGISYLNDQNMAVLKSEAELLAEITDLPASPNGNAEGNWKHYSYNLSKWAGQNVYIAFVNKNNNQSAVLVNNVAVQREILYTIGFSNDDRVIDLNEINIAGTFTVKTKDFASGAISLVLKDADEAEVATISWPSISGTSIVDRPIPMNFSKPLTLKKGKENKFTITINFDGKDGSGNDFKRTEIYNGAISNLMFNPTKRVVLEEMTGTTCPNCPQGHISIEACERQYKDQFIPISIHSYDGDDLGAAFRGYSEFLGLKGAPTGVINRKADSNGNTIIYFPMYGTGNAVYYDMAEQNLWYNIVAQELEIPALCDVNATATYSTDKKQIKVNADVKYALDTNQSLSVFFVVLEDGIVSYQENNFAQSDATGLGEWGSGGIYGSYYAYPVTHNDVVRNIVGDTYSGTLGLLPSEFTAGEKYSITPVNIKISDAILDKDKVNVVVMLIDTKTGEVVNAVRAKVNGDTTSIEDVDTDAPKSNVVYNLSGVRVSENGMQNLPAGIYIMNGKTIIKR